MSGHRWVGWEHAFGTIHEKISILSCEAWLHKSEKCTILSFRFISSPIGNQLPAQSKQGRQNAASLVPGLQTSRDLQGRSPGAARCCRVCYSGSTSPCGELKAAWRAMIWIEKITLILQMFAPILFEAAGCIPCFPDLVVYYLG